MSRQILAFNKKGDQTGIVDIPEIIYLKDEKTFIQDALEKGLRYDGIVLLIDWKTQKITTLRHAE